MYILCFYVPASHLESVKEAVFLAGGGRLGQYEQCAWQTKGQGQFKALEGAHPAIGVIGRVESIEEYKVEIAVGDSHIEQAIAALKLSHPYEEVAYHVIKSGY